MPPCSAAGLAGWLSQAPRAFWALTAFMLAKLASSRPTPRATPAAVAASRASASLPPPRVEAQAEADHRGTRPAEVTFPSRTITSRSA